MPIKGTQAWVRYLDKVELPVLSKTLKSICFISESNDVKIDELVKAILNDADLTSKVLKLANSACYNPMRVQLSTMSRAIVQVGFDSIKTIAISSVLIDQLAKKDNQQHLFNCLVRSFHAAVQAKYMAADLNEEEQEAIFIAALLFDVGEAAFWSCSSSQTSVLEEKLTCHSHKFIDDQHDVLGTSFKSISLGLVKTWHLGPLLEESLKKPNSKKARIVCSAVELAHKHAHGWNKFNLTELIASIATFTGKSNIQIKNDIKRNTTEAGILAEQFGIKGAKSFLKEYPIKKHPRPNTDKQFECLLKISEHISNNSGIEKLLSLTLESIQKTIGFDRCAFFISKPNSNCFHIVKSTGSMTQEWRSKTLNLSSHHAILKILNNNETQCLPKDTISRNFDLTHASSAPFSNMIDAVIGPINSLGNSYGFIYADRLNQATIDNEQISSFRLFAQQLQLIFSTRHRQT